MNFEVYCFDFVDDSLQVVQKEYFDTYITAKVFANNSDFFDTSITPMNEAAEAEMHCIECGGKWGQDYCNKCKYNKH